MPSWDHSDTYSSATTCSSTWTAGCSVVVKGCILQGGRWYFPPREITALVGGPGNMAVYHHILVIPPTAIVVTAENRKTAYRRIALPPTKCRHVLVLPLLPKKNTKSRYRENVPPTLNTAKRLPPTLDTAQKVPPTLDTAQKVPPILDTAEKVPRTLDTAQKVPAFLFVFVLCSLFFLVLQVPFR